MERRTEWLLCRHLAELADRFERRDPALGAYADVYQLARVRFGMGARRARERMRIGRALRTLPQIERAFVEDRLGYARVREVTRVATSDTEGGWLQAASELPLRVLERRVAEARGGTDTRTEEPATARWASPDSIELDMVLPATAWVLLQRAMEGARRRSEASLSDAEALEAVARDALARQADGTDRADVRNVVVLYACRTCRRAEIETGRGPVELSEPAAARLACDAKCCDLETEGRTVSRGGPLPVPVRRAVLLRNRMQCRAPGCTRRRYVDVHHIEPRERGGAHSRSNCVTLCTSCHDRIHDGRLRVEGDAEGTLRFRDVGSDSAMEPVTPGGHQATRGATLAIPQDAGERTTTLGSHDVDPATPGGHDESNNATTAWCCDDDNAATPGGHDRRERARSPADHSQGEPPTSPGSQDDRMGSAAARLLSVMGARGAWHPDRLCQESGLPARAVLAALTELEIAGRVRRGAHGHECVGSRGRALPPALPPM